MPKVSVCVPSYNYGHYIDGCIRSVLGQTYKDWELVVVDNHSSDATSRVVRSFHDPRIRYYENDENIGLVANWNRCITLSRGEYVAILPADDRHLPGMLERSVEMLDSHPRVGFCHTSYHWIDESGRIIDTKKWWDSDQVFSGLSELRKLVLGCYISPASVVVRRECYRELGGFDESYRFEIDWLMWSRIALAYDVAYLAEPLACQRHLHKGSVTAKTVFSQPHLRTSEDLRLLGEIFSRLPSTLEWRKIRRKAHRNVMDRHFRYVDRLFRQGEMNSVRAEIAYALRADHMAALRYRKMVVLGAASMVGSRFARILGSVESDFWRMIGRA